MTQKKIILPLLLIVFTCHQLKADTSNKLSIEFNYCVAMHTNLLKWKYGFKNVNYFNKGRLAYHFSVLYTFKKFNPFVSFYSVEFIEKYYPIGVTLGAIEKVSFAYRKNFTNIGLEYNFHGNSFIKNNAFVEFCIPITSKIKYVYVTYNKDSIVNGTIYDESPLTYRIGINNCIKINRKLDISLKNYFEKILFRENPNYKYPITDEVTGISGSFLSTSIGLRYKF